MGLIPNEWILIMALAMSMSFIISSPINHYAHQIFDYFKPLISRLNRDIDYIDQETYQLGNARYLLIGLSDIGRSAYRYLNEVKKLEIHAIDYDHELIEQLKHEGMNASWGDATDSVFWENADLSKIEMVLFTMDDHPSIINSLKEIRKINPGEFKIGVICHYPDEFEELKKLDVDYVYDYRQRLGQDFAEGLEEQLSIS
jgi:voltage-gated potassium channel Kch